MEILIVEREQRRAVRIAYSHARAGDEAGMAAWLELAERFAQVSPKQLEHSQRLLEAARTPSVIPGQLELVQAIAAAQAAQARRNGYRDASARYGG